MYCTQKRDGVLHFNNNIFLLFLFTFQLLLKHSWNPHFAVSLLGNSSIPIKLQKIIPSYTLYFRTMFVGCSSIIEETNLFEVLVGTIIPQHCINNVSSYAGIDDQSEKNYGHK